MKKLILFTFLIVNSLVFGQGPTIEGTYFPVRNTSIKQVWDTTFNTLPMPSSGANQVWDYSNVFTNIVDTFQFKMLAPSATPYASYYPGATHAAFLRTPFNNAADSLYTYYQVNNKGLYNMGGYSIKSGYDSSIINTPYEFYAPTNVIYGITYYDTSKYIAYAKNILNNKIKLKGRKIKNSVTVGYGTLKIPNGTFNNVVMVKETTQTLDSIFADLLVNGNYVFIGTQLSAGHSYQFLRNNTFGSAYLMYLSANVNNTAIKHGWYTLPVDFGSISGSVYTSTAEVTTVNSGEAYLYRENSNFSKNDILAKTQLGANGSYKFDSIPYGEYRIAIRPNETNYPNSMITYFGDSTDWITATSIITTTLTSPGHKIHIKYHAPPNGSNNLTGRLDGNPFISRSAFVASNPVPGVSIVVKKNPGTSARTVVTNTNGDFSLGALENGDYVLFVDMPGLYMSGTYSFNVTGGNIVNGLDFTVGNDSIHPFSSVISVKELTADAKFNVSAYPNPYKHNTNIEIDLKENTMIVLEAYNLIGQKIQTIDTGNKPKGNYTYEFSANKLGYSAGIYFIKLRAGATQRVIKVIEQ